MISRRTLIVGMAALAGGCADRTPQATPFATSRIPAEPTGPMLDALIDISHSTRVTDFSVVRQQGNILGIIHKATEGGDWRDPLYAVRRPQAEAAGLLWGAYHFGTHQYSGAQQAAAFLDAVHPDPTTVMALDLEPNDRAPANTMTLEQAEEFVLTVYQATRRFPLIYTHPAWANGSPYGRWGMRLAAAVGSRSILAACDLWLADYRPDPELPEAWAAKGWRMWQYAGDNSRGGGGSRGYLSRTVAGIERCDRNLFSGNSDTLYRYWRNSGFNGA